jgi:hypothetical protein
MIRQAKVFPDVDIFIDVRHTVFVDRMVETVGVRLRAIQVSGSEVVILNRRQISLLLQMANLRAALMKCLMLMLLRLIAAAAAPAFLLLVVVFRLGHGQGRDCNRQREGSNGSHKYLPVIRNLFRPGYLLNPRRRLLLPGIFTRQQKSRMPVSTCGLSRSEFL